MHLGTKMACPIPCITCNGLIALCAFGYIEVSCSSVPVTSKGRLPYLSLRCSSSPGGYISHSLTPQTLTDQLYDL